MDHANVEIVDYERTDKGRGHVVYNIRVEFRNTIWMLEKRYNEFAELHNILTREQGKLEMELPKRRLWGRFQPDFLKTRMEQLQEYLYGCGHIALTTSDALADFFKVADHMDWGRQDGRGLLGAADDDAIGREAVAQAYQAKILDRTDKSLIDISRVGIEIEDEGQMKARRAKLLKDCDYFRGHEKHFKSCFLKKIPEGSKDLDDPDEMVKVLSKPYSSAVEEQDPVSLGTTTIIVVTSRIREMEVQVGGDLVTHM